MRINKILNLEYYISILLIIVVIGLIFPYGFPLFSIFSLIYFLFFTITNKISLKINIGVVLYYIFSMIFLLGVLKTTNGINPLILSSGINIISIIMITFVFGNSTENSFQQIKKNFFIGIACLSPILAVFSLYKYILLLKDIKIQFLIIEGREYPWGTSLMPDYNMFSLGMIISLIACLYVIQHTKNIFFRYYSLIGFILILFSIFLSGSRRGLIIIAILLVYFVLKFLFLFIKIKTLNKFILVIVVIFLLIITNNLLEVNNFTIINPNEVEKLKYRYSTINEFENSFSSRTERWEYANELIFNYSPRELLFGKGFDYHFLYSQKYDVETGVDYPHNIFISTFLYSGIFGLIILLVIIIIPFIRGILENIIFKEEMFIIYILCLIYFFVSADTLFSINILWIINLLFVCSKSIKSEKNKELGARI